MRCFETLDYFVLGKVRDFGAGQHRLGATEARGEVMPLDLLNKSSAETSQRHHSRYTSGLRTLEASPLSESGMGEQPVTRWQRL